MRRLLAAIAATTLTLSLAACKPEGGGSPNPSEGNRPRRNPQVGAPAPDPKKGGEEAAQPAPVQGDPSAHNTQPGEVDLFLYWESENPNTPSCKWSKNGVEAPCNNMGQARREDGHQLLQGFWEHTVPNSRAGDVFEIKAYGTRAVHHITCELFWKSKGHVGEMIDGPNACRLTYTLE